MKDDNYLKIIKKIEEIKKYILINQKQSEYDFYAYSSNYNTVNNGTVVSREIKDV